MKKFWQLKIFLIPVILIIAAIYSFTPNNKGDVTKKVKIDNIKTCIITDMQNELEKELTLWYPLTLDKVNGGYFSDVNYKWELKGKQNKMIVTQARHVWSNANASIYYKKKKPFYNIAQHGFKFLKNVMWDKKYGGFYNLVDRKGNPLKDNGEIIKQVYGNSYAIFGLAAYFKAFCDSSALKLAIKTFNWMEKHSYDPEYGGYFQFMKRDGTPFKNGYRGTPPKDQNSMIHILECFSELYNVWPNSKLKEQYNSILQLIRDTAVGQKKYLTLFFKQDWSPISYKDSSSTAQNKAYEFDHISFGHNVETAFLMLEASKILGIVNDTVTLKTAKDMVDFTLKSGWDSKNGGIYDGGYIFKGNKKATIVKDTKEWWCQIEALNSFLMMAELFPKDANNYYEKFNTQWNYMKKYLFDKKYGGWFWDSLDTSPKSRYSPKGTIWKVNYHTTRGLINCIKRLKEMKS